MNAATDAFKRHLRIKSRESWSTDEIIAMFKHRYGDNWDYALANMMMEMAKHTPHLTKNSRDRKYAKMWKNAMEEVDSNVRS